jgi:putative tricarboxylic transport membrane protein
VTPEHARRRDRVVGAVLLVFSAVVVVASWRLPGTAAADAVGPKAYPMALALLLAVLSVVLVLGTGKKKGGELLTRDQVLKGFLPIAVLLVLYVLLVQRLGFALCTIALLLACFRLKGERNWRLNVAVAVGSALSIWGVFGYLLNVQLKLLPVGF